MFFLCQLPVIAKGIGKNQFKRYLELFIDTIFYSLVRFISSFIFFIIILLLGCLCGPVIYSVFGRRCRKTASRGREDTKVWYRETM